MRRCAECDRSVKHYALVLDGPKRGSNHGLCAACYQKRRLSTQAAKECGRCGKKRSLYAKGLCLYCYSQSRREVQPAVSCAQCGRGCKVFAKGICRSCYTNNRKRRGKYGIEPTEYIEMVKEQRGLCAICDRPMKRHPHMDHCHVTGIIRGLLCYTCNVGLGSFGDDPERLRAAARYIEAHRSRKVA